MDERTLMRIHVRTPFTHFESWVGDVEHCQPFVASIVAGEAVSLCCAVRTGDLAQEAGVETAEAHRGRGHAAATVAARARAVRETGRIPLYSTSWENEASLALAAGSA